MYTSCINFHLLASARYQILSVHSVAICSVQKVPSVTDYYYYITTTTTTAITTTTTTTTTAATATAIAATEIFVSVCYNLSSVILH
jgi:uncharacterized membrane protein YjjB (DUF3815 family)